MRIFPDDSIDRLDLDIRTSNALHRSGIHTIGQLVRALDGDLMRDVRNFGVKSLAEVEERLSDTELDLSFFDQAKVENPDPPLALPTSSIGAATQISTTTIPNLILRWQASLISKHLSLRLLHEQAVVSGHTIGYWLDVCNNPALDQQLFDVYKTILGSGVTICEEVSTLFHRFITNRNVATHLPVLLGRFGNPRKTLDDIGTELALTRERVRQIEKRIVTDLPRLVDPSAFPMLRVQSALLMARDLDLELTFDRWASEISTSGLLGIWPESSTQLGEPINLMLSICGAIGGCIPDLAIPENLYLVSGLVTEGRSDLPANLLLVRDNITKPQLKMIRRHTQFTGAVDAQWLAEEFHKPESYVPDALQALGYRAVSHGWYCPSIESVNSDPCLLQYFSRTMRRMTQFCGPLSTDELCSGLRHSAHRTQFPVPPAEILKAILGDFGFVNLEEAWIWEGKSEEKLSEGERVILECIHTLGVVVHHAELAKAFINSRLAFVTLHATLKSSPLFKRVAPALYAVRGTKPSDVDIERALANADRTPMDVSVTYKRTGETLIDLTLGVLAAATGVVFSEQLPNLSGEWDCFVDNKFVSKIEATDGEMRRLLVPLNLLECEFGDRIRFTFNMWDRRVTIETLSRANK